jgi:hypothetical protein
MTTQMLSASPRQFGTRMAKAGPTTSRPAAQPSGAYVDANNFAVFNESPSSMASKDAFNLLLFNS